MSRLDRSFGTVASWVARDPSLSTTAKATYAVLATYADNETGLCWPSLPTLAADLGASAATVERAVYELRDHGVLTREQRFENGRQTTSVTKLTDIQTTPRPSAVPERLLTSEDPPAITGEEQNKTSRNKTSRNKTSVGRSRATATPDLFPITDQMRRWWSERSDPRVNLDRETENFLDHHRARGSTFKDWTAAWRTWMTNAVTFAQRDSRGRPPQPREVRNPI